MVGRSDDRVGGTTGGTYPRVKIEEGGNRVMVTHRRYLAHLAVVKAECDPASPVLVDQTVGPAGVRGPQPRGSQQPGKGFAARRRLRPCAACSCACFVASV
jgi:hypothetical protein